MKTRLTYLLLPLFLLLMSTGTPLHGQVSAGEDITISAGLPVELVGIYEGYTGIPVTAQDDFFTGPFDIGFEFTYFGETHSQFAIGPNGLVSFDLPGILDVVHWTGVPIPNSTFEKTIMGPYQDLFSRPTDPHDRYIYYRSVGETPDRKLIVGWCEAPMFSCENQLATYQIVLHENGDTIENHLLSKPACEANLGNIATQGVNYDDVTGVAVPGRNSSSWTASQESWLFAPNGNDSYIVSETDFEPEVIVPQGKLEWAWFKNSYPGGERISDEQTVVVHPLETNRYIVEITTCDGLKYTDEMVVNAIPIPNAFNPNSEVEQNREFKVFAQPDDRITKYSMYIYNRWGQEIFHSNDILEGWDGTHNGSPCNQGVYVWTVYYESDGGAVTNKGVVTLVR